MELNLSQEAFGRRQEAKEKAEEKAKKVTEDLRRECFSRYLDLFGIKRMLIIRLSYLQSIDVKPRRSSRYSWNK